jgi:hypothetical protein
MLVFILEDVNLFYDEENFTGKIKPLRCASKSYGSGYLSLFQTDRIEQDTVVLMNGENVLMFGSTAISA